MVEASADRVFLTAFDRTIDEACRELASQGVAEDAIWAGFEKAVRVMNDLMLDVDRQVPAAVFCKLAMRVSEPGPKNVAS